MLERSLTGVFCDDIRHELYGKKSLIGCYTGAMELSEFPATLPKLGIHVIVQAPADRPIRSVKLVVLRDEEKLGEGDMIEIPTPPHGISGPLQLQRMDAQFVFAPLTIEQPCTIKVRAIINEEEELRGLALPIVKRQDGDDANGAHETEAP